MSGVSDAIVIGTPLLVALGSGVAFVWNKIEKRFQSIEEALASCRKSERNGRQRGAIKLTVIELLWLEVKTHLPDSPALVRARLLLDGLHDEQDED